MSVDADRVVALANSAHELWSLPVQILVALVLLYTQVPETQPLLISGLFSLPVPPASACPIACSPAWTIPAWLTMAVFCLVAGMQCRWAAPSSPWP